MLKFGQMAGINDCIYMSGKTDLPFQKMKNRNYYTF